MNILLIILFVRNFNK